MESKCKCTYSGKVIKVLVDTVVGNLGIQPANKCRWSQLNEFKVRIQGVIR